MQTELTATKRKYYLDNIRWFAILLVFLHHVFYMFNSEGVTGHFIAPGIAQMDIFSQAVYPFFMGLLFLVSGMSMRLSLAHRTDKEFRKERFAKLMRPFIFGMLIISPIVAYHMFTSGGTLGQVFDGMGNVPTAVKYIELYIMCFLIGMAQLWFIGELYIISRFTNFLRKRKLSVKLDGFMTKCSGSTKNIVITISVIGVLYVLLAKSVDLICRGDYLSSGLLLVLRPQLYLFVFLAGFYFFSKDEVAARLKKAAVPLLLAAAALGVLQCVLNYGGTFNGANGLYSYSINFNFLLTALYAFAAIIAFLGCFSKWFDNTNKFTRYMASRSFGFYIFHYIIIVFAADFVVNYLHVGLGARYALTALIGAVGTVAVTEIIRFIPGVSTMFGIRKPAVKHKKEKVMAEK